MKLGRRRLYEGLCIGLAEGYIGLKTGDSMAGGMGGSGGGGGGCGCGGGGA